MKQMFHCNLIVFTTRHSIFSMIKNILSSLLVLLSGAFVGVRADNLVILHTNDTHSQIEPTDKNLGGVQRRKALVDSVRSVHKNVMLVDAGDMVQGTLYFTLFNGEVETKVMNYLKYDIQILGNHEFDNGVDALAKIFGGINAKRLSTNYNFTDTPLAPLFSSYDIREFGNRKIGFIAINLDPKGMISDRNRRGVEFLDIIKAANSTAWHLKHNEKVDLVVMLSHIGYDNENGVTDTELVAASEDIDIVIGGHSHTVINPSSPNSKSWLVKNAVGKDVLVAQTGSAGRNVGEIDIDLDSLSAVSRLLQVDSRYDKYFDSVLDDILKPYKVKVQEYSVPIAKTTTGLSRKNCSFLNWATDYVKHRGNELLKGAKVDIALMNKGGIRCDFPLGVITKGLVMQAFPFKNRVVVIELKGQDLLDAFDVMATRGGDGVSKGVEITFDSKTSKCVSATLNGKPIEAEKNYLVATIDYLANGGDYMSSLTNGVLLAQSQNVVYDDMIQYISKLKKPIKADETVRMKAVE